MDLPPDLFVVFNETGTIWADFKTEKAGKAYKEIVQPSYRNKLTLAHYKLVGEVNNADMRRGCTDC